MWLAMSSYAGPTVSVHVSIAVDPANREAFLAALKPTFEKVIAEPLNIFFEVYQDPSKPGVFKLVENWNASPEYMINVSDGPSSTPSNHEFTESFHHRSNVRRTTTYRIIRSSTQCL